MADVPVVMPDVTTLAVAYLTAHPLVAPYGARISADLKGYQARDRWLWLVRSGGTRPISYRLDAPRLDVNAYAEDKPTASKLAESALAALLNAHTASHEDAVVTNVDVFSDLADLTDPLNNEPRYVFSVTVWLHPKP